MFSQPYVRYHIILLIDRLSNPIKNNGNNSLKLVCKYKYRAIILIRPKSNCETSKRKELIVFDRDNECRYLLKVMDQYNLLSNYKLNVVQNNIFEILNLFISNKHLKIKFFFPISHLYLNTICV